METGIEQVVANRQGRKKRPAFAPTLILITLLASYIVYRRLTSTQIVTVTRPQIENILGTDLGGASPVLYGPSVNGSSLQKLVNHPAVGIVSRSMRLGPSLLTSNSKQIRSSTAVTDDLERLTKGKRFDPLPDPNTSGMALQVMARMYRGQMSLEAALKDPRRCYRAVMGALDFNRFFMTSSPADMSDVFNRYATQQALLSGITGAVGADIFDGQQLAAIYKGLDPAPETDLFLAEGIRRGFPKEIHKFIDLAEGKALAELLGPIGEDELDADGFVAGELNLPKTIRQAAELVRVHIANLQRPWLQRDKSATDFIAGLGNRLPEIPDVKVGDNPLTRFWETTRFKMKMRNISNSLGLIAISRIVPLQDVEVSFEFRTMQEAHRLRVLLAMYRKQHHGALPPTLEAVRPLSGKRPLPRDMFSGKPFLYSPSRKVFWSVGPDGIDGGGQFVNELANATDIVWRIR